MLNHLLTLQSDLNMVGAGVGGLGHDLHAVPSEADTDGSLLADFNLLDVHHHFLLGLFQIPVASHNLYRSEDHVNLDKVLSDQDVLDVVALVAFLSSPHHQGAQLDGGAVISLVDGNMVQLVPLLSILGTSAPEKVLNFLHLGLSIGPP